MRACVCSYVCLFLCVCVWVANDHARERVIVFDPLVASSNTSWRSKVCSKPHIIIKPGAKVDMEFRFYRRVDVWSTGVTTNATTRLWTCNGRRKSFGVPPYFCYCRVTRHVTQKLLATTIAFGLQFSKYKADEVKSGGWQGRSSAAVLVYCMRPNGPDNMKDMPIQHFEAKN